MVQLLHTLRQQLFTKKVPVAEIVIQQPVFDSKYKTILEYRYNENYSEMVNWIDFHSNGSVDIKYDGDFQSGCYDLKSVFYGFEDPDDALIFRIKFPNE